MFYVHIKNLSAMKFVIRSALFLVCLSGNLLPAQQAKRQKVCCHESIVGVERWIGERTTQEDNFCLYISRSGCAFFGVYDGHGGVSVSKFAAKNLYTYVLQVLEREEDASDYAQVGRNTEHLVRQALHEGFMKLHADLSEDIAYKQGSTAIVAFMYQGVLYVAHAGDSRAVLCSRGEAIALSQDHNFKRPDEKERIAKLGGRLADDGYVMSPQVKRIDLGNGRIRSERRTLAMTRALGDKDMAPLVIPNPEITQRTITSEDEFIVLATDGLWDLALKEQVVDIVKKSLEMSPSDYQKAARAVRECYVLNSFDNTTVMVVNVRPYCEQSSDEQKVSSEAASADTESKSKE